MTANFSNNRAADNKEVTINNWEIRHDPKTRIPYLIGKVTGHPDFEDGKQIRTSEIKKVATRNTIYILGEPA